MKKAIESAVQTVVSDDQAYLSAGVSSSRDLLLDLAWHSSARVRQRVAEREDAPLLVLLKLAMDLDWQVRLSVGENTSLPYSVLCQLAKDQCIDVRYGLAENSCLPNSILVYLASDENPYVACRALETLTRLRIAYARSDELLCLALRPSA